MFLSDWYSETDELLGDEENVPAAAVPADPSPDALVCQVVPSGPAYEGENNLRLFLSLVSSAQERVIITSPYFVPDEAMMYAITSAKFRGLDVQLFVSEIGDQGSVWHAQRSYYSDLLRAGVRIWLYPGPFILHAKHLSIDDDVAVIGSSNMDIRSFNLNFEISLLVRGRVLRLGDARGRGGVPLHRPRAHPRGVAARARLRHVPRRRRTAHVGAAVAEGDDGCSQAIGHILPIALAVAISSVPIMATIVILLSPKGTKTALPFLIGWVLGMAVIVTLCTLGAQVIPAPRSDRREATAIAVAEILVGIALVVVAIIEWRRARRHPSDALPKWLSSVDKLGPWSAFGIAFALNVRPKGLLLAIAAGLAIRAANLSVGESAIVIAIYTIIGALTVAVPVILSLVDRKGTQPRLLEMKDWLAHNSATVTVAHRAPHRRGHHRGGAREPLTRWRRTRQAGVCWCAATCHAPSS